MIKGCIRSRESVKKHWVISSTWRNGHGGCHAFPLLIDREGTMTVSRAHSLLSALLDNRRDGWHRAPTVRTICRYTSRWISLALALNLNNSIGKYHDFSFYIIMWHHPYMQSMHNKITKLEKVPLIIISIKTTKDTCYLVLFVWLWN